MQMQINKRVKNDAIELTIEDNTSGLAILKIDITKDDFYKMFIQNYGTIYSEGEFFEANVVNFGKSRDFKQIPFPSNVYLSEEKEKWINENTPEGYTFYGDRNYGRDALFIKFI